MSFWPHETVLPRGAAADASPYVRSYLILRTLVGALGIALPAILIFGEPLVFDGQPFPRGSLSAYYYSGGREVFVGSLCAIGVFLVTYKIADHSWENLVSIVAGLAVITVAVFPTGRPGPRVPLTPLQARFGEAAIERIHYTAGGIFFVSLVVISYFFARLGPKTGRRSPSFWRHFHLACCGVIAAAVVFAAAQLVVNWPAYRLLAAEMIAVWAFGASWLMKGFEIVEDAFNMR